MYFGIDLSLPRRSFWCDVVLSVLVLFLMMETTSSFTRRDAAMEKLFTRKQLLNNLNKYHLSQREAVVLNDAAEFAIQSYSSGSEKPKLTGIIDFKKYTRLPTLMLYKLHVLYQDENGPLKDKYFSVYVCKNKTGRARFKLSEAGERLPRDQSLDATCDQLSKWANCSQCGFRGICVQGTARISPWLQFALKTQREIQMDVPVNHVQFLGAHNAYNNRASGYGDLDDCHWPLKADDVCISLANQEFSFTDQLNMGVRHLEVDLWKCFGKIRMSHGNGELNLGCSPWDREFTEGMKEISDWTQKSKNRNEIIQIFFDDHTSDHDDWAINHAIKQYFGDKVLTPSDLKLKFSGRWPNMREMRLIKKTVIFIDSNDHSGQYLHRHFWTNSSNVKSFSPKLNNCSAIGNSEDVIRVYSDSTHYGPLWNGAKQAGTIMDFNKYLLCGVNIPSADQINPELMKTAIFTWAEGERKQPVTESSCVVLSGDKRWYVTDCADKNYFACVSKRDKTYWSISSNVGKYPNPSCHENTEFSVPHNGYEHEQLVKAAKGKTVWLNLRPFLPFLEPQNVNVSSISSDPHPQTRDRTLE